MLYYYVSIAYTFTNLVLALTIYLKGRRSLINQFYIFCVGSLSAMGFSAYLLTLPQLQPLEFALVSLLLFLFSLLPFFFLHFMVIFLRRYDILKSRKIIFAIYFAGLFSYAMVLKRMIPGPITTEGVFSTDGYIYYITWMSIMFSVGIALLFSLLEGFTERGSKTGLLMTGFALLMLVLPSPFTESIYSSLFQKNTEWYGLSSALSLLIAIYLIFRHKILVTLYDAVKTALVVMNDVFILTNENFQIELFRGAVGLLGYSEKEMYHRELNDIIEQKHYIENYLSYVRNGKMRECLFDADVTCADGRKLIMDFSFSPVFEHDEIAGFVGVARDVTKRKIMEYSLRASEERFRRLSENARDIIYRYRFQPVPGFEYVSPAATEVTQYTPEEYYANPDLFLDIIHPDDRWQMEKYFRGEDDFNQMVTTRMIRKDGKTIWVEQRNKTLHDEQGMLIAMEGIARDITDRILLEDQLRQAQKLESIGTLAGGIAHDFNNILTIIMGYASLLKEREMGPERQTQAIETIQKAVNRGAGMVGELLTIARKSDVHFASTNVNRLIEEMVPLLQETFPKTITISRELSIGDSTVTADQNQLQQALLNIFVNARDAMPNGGTLSIGSSMVAPGELGQKFSGADSQPYFCITVSDTGTGMNEEVRQRVFEPFFTTKDQGKGTGLGLAVVYAIVRSHRGFISVDSEANEGTRFSIYLPKQMHAAESSAPKDKGAPAPLRGTETVLLVEDEEMLLQLVRNLLEEKGYHVYAASDGQEAMRLYEKNHKSIDAVITDLGLPKLGGLELFRAMRKINPKVKVIIASGFFEPESQAGMKSEGVHFFVQKPYEPNDILLRLREALNEPAG